ncbi:MAG: DNA methyltransferase, partial [Pseudonocardiaceae bacterium]
MPTSTGKNGHGAEFPLALAGRCITLTSREGDPVLDPCVGSGTTALAGAELGRRCIGYDINKQYVDVAERRLAAAVQRNPRDGDGDGAEGAAEEAGLARVRAPRTR